MANNIPLTPGAGVIAATDEVGAAHYQRVKITDGTEDGATHLMVVSEDAAHTTGDTGLVLMAVRSDTAAALAGTDGDYLPLITDANGHLWVALSSADSAALTDIETALTSVVSTNNSTTTPLGIDGTFVGTGDDVEGYAAVTILLSSDQDGAADGMKFEFSTDNTNWDDAYAFNMSAGVSRRFQFPVTAKYFRVNYTNGGVAQTAFRVQTMLHRQNVLTSIHVVEDNVVPDRSAQLVKSVIIAQINGSGDFIPVQANASGVLKIGGSVDAQPFTALAEGGLTELIGINEQVDQNDYSASVGIALGGTYSGEMLNFGFYSTEDGTGTVLTPSGHLLLLDADPAVSAGDTSITAAEWVTVLGKVTVEASDWVSDANGAFAYVSATPVPFHALSTIYAVWLHTDATSYNSVAGDDQQLEINLWYRRDS